MDEQQEMRGDTPLSFAEYMRLQIEKIWSPFNKWVTGERVGHDPTPDELAKNYIENGGAEDHQKEHGWKLEV